MAINRSVNYSIFEPPVPGSLDWNMVTAWWLDHKIPALPEIVYLVLDTGMPIPDDAAPTSRPPREVMQLQWSRPVADPKKLWQGNLIMGAAECLNDPDHALAAVMRFYGTPYSKGEAPVFSEPETPKPPPDQPHPNPPVSPIGVHTGGNFYACSVSEPTPHNGVLTWEGKRYLKNRRATPFGTACWWELLS